MQEKILILDFGSPYTQLLARRVRELNVYCEIVPFNKIPAIDASTKGVILSGSPYSVNDSKAFVADLSAIKGKLPLLGVCYGAQMVAKTAGAKIETVGERDYGRAQVTVKESADLLLSGVSAKTQMWMSLGERITSLPSGISTIATGEDGGILAYKIDGEQTWGVDFHPEVFHSTEGPMLFKNFVIGVCGCKQNWTAKLFVESTVAELRQMLGNDKVVLGLSGGVDSSVSAVLLHKAIGANLVCIFVDTGLMRKNEPAEVLESYKNMGLNVIGVCAKDKFLGDLLGVTDPEQKRKIIGRDFIEVFDAQAKKIKDVKWLGQGTIYPDIVESVSVTGPGVAVKSHHNVGGLPEKMNLSIVEPLKLLFKDEVRRVGKELGISPEQLGRHPFPGPGLGIRVLGEVTAAKIDTIQQADKIFIDALKAEGLYDKVWQAGCMLLPAMSVGVSGDQRTWENALALRVVNSVDGMTADWVELPYAFLGRVSNEIISKVKGINRVVYDISSKPPATIEWE